MQFCNAIILFVLFEMAVAQQETPAPDITVIPASEFLSALRSELSAPANVLSDLPGSILAAAASYSSVLDAARTSSAVLSSLESQITSEAAATSNPGLAATDITISRASSTTGSSATESAATASTAAVTQASKGAAPTSFAMAAGALAGAALAIFALL